MNCIDLKKARAVYREGGNVSEFLRSELGESANSSEIIEIMYDLQAGTYIEYLVANWEKINVYAKELSTYLEPQLSSGDSLLDVGAGELTTLNVLINSMSNKTLSIYAFDLSWSRLSKGVEFWKGQENKKKIEIFPFVADIKKIPLATKSIDVVTSNHALEPNGKNLLVLLAEIFRVAKKKVVLFEPSYELNSEEGKKRMDHLGYIKNIEKAVDTLGGKVLGVDLIASTDNKLNPTACFMIEPPGNPQEKHCDKQDIFTVPGTNYALQRQEDYMVSADTGLLFPVLKNIPVLNEKSAILATSYFV